MCDAAREEGEGDAQDAEAERATMWKVDVCGLLRVYVTVKSAESSSEEG